MNKITMIEIPKPIINIPSPMKTKIINLLLNVKIISIPIKNKLKTIDIKDILNNAILPYRFFIFSIKQIEISYQFYFDIFIKIINKFQLEF